LIIIREKKKKEGIENLNMIIGEEGMERNKPD
jgi:hypothetical protein